MAIVAGNDEIPSCLPTVITTATMVSAHGNEYAHSEYRKLYGRQIHHSAAALTKQ
jgi:hypothetical protein